MHRSADSKQAAAVTEGVSCPMIYTYIYIYICTRPQLTCATSAGGMRTGGFARLAFQLSRARASTLEQEVGRSLTAGWPWGICHAMSGTPADMVFLHEQHDCSA